MRVVARSLLVEPSLYGADLVDDPGWSVGFGVFREGTWTANAKPQFRNVLGRSGEYAGHRQMHDFSPLAV